MNTCAQRAPVSLALAFFYAGTVIISLTTFRPVASFFNGSDTLYLISALLLFIRLLHTGHSPVKVFVYRNPFFKPLLLFIFGATLSLINSSDLAAATTVMGKYIFFFGIWLPAGIYLLDTPRRIKWMLVVLVVASLVPIIPAIGDYYFQTKITAAIDRLLGMNLLQTTPLGGRFGSVMGHPNNFGFMLVVVFPIYLWLLFDSKRLHVKALALIMFCMLLAGSLVTASRSMAVAISIQTVVFIAFMPDRTLKIKAVYFIILLMLIAGVFIVAVKAMPVIIVDRFVEMAANDLGEFEPDSDRINLMIEAWQAICAHPIAGLGVENTSANFEVIGVHNTILRLWAGIGVSGLVFICWIYLLAFHASFINLMKAGDSIIETDVSISFLVLVSLIGWSLVDMVQPQFYDRFKFVTLILIFSISRLIEKGIGTSFPPKKQPSQLAYAK